MNAKALYATLVLGVQLIWHIVRRILGRPSPGLKVFLANYRDDGIPTMSSEEKALLYELSRCVSCRLCDSLCAILPNTNPADFMGPAFHPSTASRLIPDYPYVNLDTGACDTCAGCDAICPRDVPIRDTFNLMRRKVEAIGS
jgi:succinate dehydrogenase/fumarate reductase-like Fe-S protein